MNTRTLARADRKRAKRAARKRIKLAYASLTPKQRGELAAFEGTTTLFMRDKGLLPARAAVAKAD